MKDKNTHTMKQLFSFVLMFLLSVTLFAFQSTIFSYADTTTGSVQYQTKATKTTAVGNPPSSGGGTTGNIVSDYAANLITAIKNAPCPATSIPVPGYVEVNNTQQTCLDKIKASTSLPNLPDVLTRLHLSVNEANSLVAPYTGNLQCAGFVQAVSIGIGAKLPDGDAGSYNHNISNPNYTFYPKGTKMQLGDIVVWSNHIAVVIETPKTDINGNTASFRVAEANGGSGSVGEEVYPAGDNPYGTGLTYLGYLRKQ